jgi:hypothetical protein
MSLFDFMSKKNLERIFKVLQKIKQEKKRKKARYIPEHGPGLLCSFLPRGLPFFIFPYLYTSIN